MKIIKFLLPILCLLLCLSGCIGNKFVNDPVKWSYVSGEGTWDAGSRRWTVYLSPGETKSMMIKLFNSGSQDTTVFTVPVSPTDRVRLNSQVRLHLLAGSSMEITLRAIADPNAASGSRRYVIKYNSSFYGPADFKDVTN
jgi:hypothetical protein